MTEPAPWSRTAVEHDAAVRRAFQNGILWTPHLNPSLHGDGPYPPVPPTPWRRRVREAVQSVPWRTANLLRALADRIDGGVS